ncbi:MAG: hypothetical protein JRN15_16510 [Nitrososphaerota archaeon]|nr:hypothetical protein [Nitrososphaerota archaeon]
MASKIAEKAPGWFSRILMPELAEIKGELKNVHTRIDALDAKVDSVKNEMKSDIARVETKVEELDKRLSNKIDSVDQKLSNKIDDLDKRLDIVQRLSVLEAKVAEQRN